MFYFELCIEKSNYLYSVWEIYSSILIKTSHILLCTMLRPLIWVGWCTVSSITCRQHGHFITKLLKLYHFFNDFSVHSCFAHRKRREKKKKKKHICWLTVQMANLTSGHRFLSTSLYLNRLDCHIEWHWFGFGCQQSLLWMLSLRFSVSFRVRLKQRLTCESRAFKISFFHIQYIHTYIYIYISVFLSLLSNLCIHCTHF